MRTVKRIILITLSIFAFILLIGECNNFIMLLATKVLGFLICYIIRHLWLLWNMDEDKIVKFLINDGLCRME